MEGPSGVCGDKLHVHHVAGERGIGSVGGTGFHNGLRQCPCSSGVNRDVEEPGTGNIH
jgi:hypothetical protein